MDAFQMFAWAIVVILSVGLVFLIGYHFGMEAMRAQYSRRQSVFWGRMRKVARGGFAQHGFRK